MKIQSLYEKHVEKYIDPILYHRKLYLVLLDENVVQHVI